MIFKRPCEISELLHLIKQSTKMSDYLHIHNDGESTYKIQLYISNVGYVVDCLINLTNVDMFVFNMTMRMK